MVYVHMEALQKNGRADMVAISKCLTRFVLFVRCTHVSQSKPTGKHQMFNNCYHRRFYMINREIQCLEGVL